MRVTGACHCGKISYVAEADPQAVAICHCADCQTLSGSPYRAMVSAAAETFHLKGQPTIYVKTADSGTRRAQAFCGECGTPLYAAAPENPKSYSLRLGAIRERHQLGKPVRQIWCDSALDWTMDLIETPRVARQT